MTPTPEMLKACSEVNDFIESALQENASLQTKNAELQSRMDQQDKVYLEKVATAKAEAAQAALGSVFPEKELRDNLKKMAALGLVTQAELPLMEQELKRTPALILPFMAKMAAAVLSAPGDGHGIEKEAGKVESDPDGWEAAAKGEPVPLISYIK